jgi:hypothetical protein
MKKLLVPVIVFAAVALYQFVGGEHSSNPQASAAALQRADSAIDRAFKFHAHGVQVEGQGEVIKVLGDDNDGSRHQRFIVRLASGQSLLIAHNIDLARRVSPLNEGDVVSFKGEYVWNSKGGVVHWTHRDPQGVHSAGWIRHNGQVFQ